MHPGCCDDENIAEKHGKRSFEVPAAKANRTGIVVIVDCEIRNAMLSLPHGDAMEVDQSSISSLLPSRNVPAGDVDFQGRIDRLKLSLDNMLAESGFISDSLLVKQDEQAREKAIIRLTQLDKAVQILSNMLERLMSSVTMHCQVAFHPRVIDGSGYTDGEGVERFWPICNRFSGVTRNMSKYNRQALVTDVVPFFRSNKMLEIPGQIVTKFKKCMKKICDLNITNQDFTKLQQQWKEHVAALLASATPSDIKDMLTKAEKQEGTANKYTYLLNSLSTQKPLKITHQFYPRNTTTNINDILNQFCLNLDAEYVCLTPPPDVPAIWAGFKPAFKARNGISVLEERQRCSSELIKIELRSGKSVPNFIDRFNGLRRGSLDQLPPSLLVERFLKAILPVLKGRINLIRQSKRIIESTDVDIINITRQLLSSMAAKEIVAIKVKTFVSTKAGSTAFK